MPFFNKDHSQKKGEKEEHSGRQEDNRLTPTPFRTDLNPFPWVYSRDESEDSDSSSEDKSKTED